MTPTHHWFRLCIDGDAALNPIGISYELRAGDRTHAIHVLEAPGPFDDLDESLAKLVADVIERYGLQAKLFGY